jgi:hypothetical protein
MKEWVLFVFEGTRWVLSIKHIWWKSNMDKVGG